jgi:hypothetical protein
MMTASIKTASWDRLVTSTPANKDAAMSMNGSSIDPTLTPRQMRENLLPHLQRIQDALKATNGEIRALLIREKLQIERQLSELNKIKPPAPDYPRHFHEAARDMLPKAMFRLICEEAYRRGATDDSDRAQ